MEEGEERERDGDEKSEDGDREIAAMEMGGMFRVWRGEQG